MKLIYKPRGKGKTTEIIKEVLKNDGILIVRDAIIKRGVVGNYPSLKGQVFSCYDVKKRGLYGIRKPVYIDDADYLLQEFIGENEIKGITITMEEK